MGFELRKPADILGSEGKIANTEANDIVKYDKNRLLPLVHLFSFLYLAITRVLNFAHNVIMVHS